MHITLEYEIAGCTFLSEQMNAECSLKTAFRRLCCIFYYCLGELLTFWNILKAVVCFAVLLKTVKLRI